MSVERRLSERKQIIFFSLLQTACNWKTGRLDLFVSSPPDLTPQSQRPTVSS